MEQAVEHLYHEMTGVRSGRASPALLENIQVDLNSERTQLSHLGTVVARGPHTLAVTVYDRQVCRVRYRHCFVSRAALCVNNVSKLNVYWMLLNVWIECLLNLYWMCGLNVWIEYVLNAY